jgi:8-oxo-dGTP pyrophosphatase MutT (NUDIX family)
MLQRNLQSDFVGGAYVFPGGGVDDADGELAARRLVVGLSDEEASQRLTIAGGGLAYYVARLRELFEDLTTRGL